MFNGQFATKRKVALGGRSRQEENREQALQRAREDRERRKKQRDELRSATLIQAGNYSLLDAPKAPPTHRRCPYILPKALLLDCAESSSHGSCQSPYFDRYNNLHFNLTSETACIVLFLAPCQPAGLVSRPRKLA